MNALTPRERHRAAVFARDAHECALSPKFTRWPGDDSQAGPCDGRLQADHILKVQLILTRRGEMQRRLSYRGWKGRMPQEISREDRELAEADPDDLIADERNGWIVCERHHGLKDRKLIVLICEVILPDHYFGFVAGYGLTPLHDREFQRPAREERSRGDGASARHR